MSARTGEKLVIRLENAITAGENRLYESAEAYRRDLRAIAAQIAEHDRRQREEIQRLHMELESAGGITPDELAKRYMELPVDADGVPIRPGDLIEFSGKGERLSVTHVGWTGRKDPTIAYRRPNGTIDCSCIGEDCHHVRPRTVEDVLFGFWHEFGRESEWKELEGRIGEYADEIRELMGGAE